MNEEQPIVEVEEVKPNPPEEISEEKIKMLNLLSRLENKLFRRAKNKNVFRRLKLLKRINHYRVLVDLKQMTLRDF